VVLTGTDLYQDLATDAAAQRSVALAQRLVVLQECGGEALPPEQRDKARVIFQSTPARPPLPKAADALEAVMVGHLRAVKAPQTLFDAARALAGRADIRITHIGDGAGEPELADRARATQGECPGYRWLGALPHEDTLERIRAAHVLVHTSTLEGGAHVILEAVRCGTPALASRVPGNVGMLGTDYEGYFPAGDAAALARLLLACRRGQEDPAGGLLARLRAQCALRSPLFDAEHERAALFRLLQELESDR
jgi:putative glycosyltransferase (TIGR04348 family)